MGRTSPPENLCIVRHETHFKWPSSYKFPYLELLDINFSIGLQPFILFNFLIIGQAILKFWGGGILVGWKEMVFFFRGG